jgi:quinol monooxygenase YgiN
MPELTLIAKTVAKAEFAEQVRAAMARLVEPSRAEPGCLQYVMHRGIEDPAIIVFVERWASADHLQAHTHTDHFKACMAAIDGMTAESELLELIREAD